MSNFHVKIRDASRTRMADLVRIYGLPVLPQTLGQSGGVYTMSAIATPVQIRALLDAGYGLDQLEDVDAVSVPEVVSTSTRTAVTAAVPVRDSYLDVDEVEQSIADLADQHPDLTELVELPNPSHEGLTSRALHLRSGSDAQGSVMFVGGVHAREWGSPDILINFAQVLTDAHASGTGISQGGFSCTDADVALILQRLDVVVFPQVNPDGRRYSMDVEPMWRKNRRPANAGDPVCSSGAGSGAGVDINRNYDFLWDYRAKYSASAGVRTSTDPCGEVFCGPAAASEPETRNVVWLMDQSPALGYFIDIHSFGEDILFNWGDDDDQTIDPDMNFNNAAYDGMRGILDSEPGGDPEKYREYLPADDQATMMSLGDTMRDAIRSASGRLYTVKTAANLYPTSGTSDDYAYSRKFTDPSTNTVLGYTIEWGPERATVPESFHPVYSDMKPIIEEITAALLAFCIDIAGRLGPAVVLPEVTGIDPAVGDEAGGTPVTITGSGFTGATDVGFGGTSAITLSVDSDTQITATSPTGTGTVDVVVITPGGSSTTTTADQFTYQTAASTPPELTEIDPAVGDEAGGTPVTITGSGFTGATDVGFGGTSATTLSVDSDTQITATSPTGTGTVDVVVITPGGSSTTTTADQFTYQTAASTPPELTEIDPAVGDEAGGTPVTITGFGFTGATDVGFGGTSATTLSVDSDTQITATSPIGTGTVDVVVITPGGISTTTTADQYTYQTADEALKR